MYMTKMFGIDVGEVRNISARITKINGELDKYVQWVRYHVTESIANSVEGSGNYDLNVGAIGLEFNRASVDVINNFEELKKFIDKQMEEYGVTTKTMGELIDDLVTKLSTCNNKFSS